MKQLGVIYSTAIIAAKQHNLNEHSFGHIGDFVLINQNQLFLMQGAQINAGSKIVSGGDFYMDSYSTVSYNVVILTGGDHGEIMNDYAPCARKTTLEE
jgi:hypothetical protein